VPSTAEAPQTTRVEYCQGAERPESALRAP